MARPLTINITTGPFYPAPPAPCGAVERYWFDLAREFVSLGHTVRILSRGHPGFPSRQTEAGVDIRRFWTFRQSGNIKLDLLKDLAFSLRLLPSIPRADITVCNCFFLPAILPRLPGAWGKTYVSVARVPKGQMKLYTRAARIHAVSSAIHRWIVEQTPAAAPITKTLPNPIDTTVFNLSTSAKTPGPPTILYTGRIHPEKGLHLLVQAFALLKADHPQLRLKLVGPSATDRGGGGDDFVASLKSLAPGLSEPDLTFAPPIYDRPALAATLRDADLYCYPSVADKGEAAPVAPLEAMAVGLVPVCSDLPQFRDYLTENETGVTFDHRAPDAPQRLAKALRSLLDNPNLRRLMGERAAKVAAGYSNAAIARRFIDDFHSLL
jgi:glycosyltransferase involved in cell wall biosynthesis